MVDPLKPREASTASVSSDIGQLEDGLVHDTPDRRRAKLESARGQVAAKLSTDRLDLLVAESQYEARVMTGQLSSEPAALARLQADFVAKRSAVQKDKLAEERLERLAEANDGRCAKLVARAAHQPPEVARRTYLKALTYDADFLFQARHDPVGAMAAFLERADVPPKVDQLYTAHAGTAGGGRVLMLMDFLRGYDSSESPLASLKGGVEHFALEHAAGPMLFLFRQLDGQPIFPNDDTFASVFRDSPIWGGPSTQVGHMMFGVQEGYYLADVEKNKLERVVSEVGLKVAGKLFGMNGIEPDLRDWVRSIAIGHELVGDAAFGPSQMQEYAKLVANGDPHQIRGHFDEALEAVRRGDHAAAWTHIRAIAGVGEIPWTKQEALALAGGKNQRFAGKPVDRSGNSGPDLALSIYGVAIGTMARSGQLATPHDAAQLFRDLLSNQGHLEAKATGPAMPVPSRR